ncbi:hypothetical protein GTV32_15125 [Gordonia sp. SID5947]|uniref:WXG100 family type VII secretion target n=1 Tax=Gordonia sp. SID5947 TaxID=2690315 RepID=UPI001367B2FC|nr:hypothetical protein [Gordonia sp. SID5947]MYR07552.1 hypothetical protein [Gordonia sp. SID5947]
MPDHLKVDVDTFRKKANEFHTLAGQMSSAEQLLADGLQHEGECWGHDDTGSSFADGYGPKATTTFQNATAHAEHLNGLADLLIKVADNYSATEEHNTSSLGPR